MPVNGGFHRQVVDEAYPQPGALAHAKLGAWCRRAESPGLGLEARHQLDIQRRCDQLVIMPGIVVFDLAQPVTRRATGAQANHNQAGEALEHLSTGEGHQCGYLVFCAIKLPAAAGDEGRIRYTCKWERLSEVLFQWPKPPCPWCLRLFTDSQTAVHAQWVFIQQGRHHGSHYLSPCST